MANACAPDGIYPRGMIDLRKFHAKGDGQVEQGSRCGADVRIDEDDTRRTIKLCVRSGTCIWPGFFCRLKSSTSSSAADEAISVFMKTSDHGQIRNLPADLRTGKTPKREPVKNLKCSYVTGQVIQRWQDKNLEQQGCAIPFAYHCIDLPVVVSRLLQCQPQQLIVSLILDNKIDYY